MRPGVFLFWALVLAVGFNLVMQAKDARRSRRLERVVREVHGMLVVWAETWPDPAIRQKLLDVLSR